MIEKLKYFNMFKVKGLIIEYTFLQHILALIYCNKSGYTKTQVFPSILCERAFSQFLREGIHDLGTKSNSF